MQLRILTLNIWGVHYVAKLIPQRIQALIQHLLDSDTDYDIIGLQEVWSKKDFVHIREQIKSKYPYSYYFLSSLIGSGCCTFSKYPIIGVYEHRYTLNGFPHKIQHGDWFCGKLIGLCKILVNGYVINVYNTHLHANYHHVIPKDIYLGHRVCQAYELIQFIESTSSADTTYMTILLGDLNLRSDDLGFRLIKGILQFNDSFLQRLNKDIFDPTVGNRSQTCDLLDNPYVTPHPHQGVGDRIDYILYRSRDDNVQCLESYHTLHKVPNHPQNLHYSDHLAVYARFEIPERCSPIQPKLVEDAETLEEEARNDLRSACIIVEESIQRLQRHRLYCFFCAIFLLCIFISFNGNALSNGYVYTLFLILKNLLCLLGLSFSLWFIVFGKPVERNALSAIRNAMHIRLRSPQFQF